MGEQTPDLPDDVAEIIGAWAAGYDTGLEWNEEAKLKADMMNVPRRWASASPAALRTKCLDVGLTVEESDRIVDRLKRRQSGRRLVPQQSYRDFDSTDSVGQGAVRRSASSGCREIPSI